MPHPGLGFPIPPFQWPRVGSQWPAYNVESDQAEGLMAWWPMLASHGTSGPVRDLVAGRFPMTQYNGPTWVNDEFGWSLLFDPTGPADYLEIDQAVVAVPPFSIACWFYSSNITSTSTLIYIGDKDAADQFYALFIVGGIGGDPIWAVSRDAVGWNQAQTSSGITQNKWHHVLGVWAAADDRRVYIDGGSKGTSATNAPVVGADRTSIARLGDSSPGSAHDGCISDARIYNVAKTDAQAYRMYSEPWELPQLPQRLWRLGVVAAPPATIVPVAMHHYRSMRL